MRDDARSYNFHLNIYVYMQSLNFHPSMLLHALRVWVAEPLVLKWLGTQQYHLLCGICEGGVQNYTYRGFSSSQHNYQYITDWDHSDWSLVWYKNYYIRVLVRGKPRYQGVPIDQFLSSNQVWVFIGGNKLYACDFCHSDLMVVTSLHMQQYQSHLEWELRSLQTTQV